MVDLTPPLNSDWPARRGFAVVLSDSTIVNCRAFHVGVAGNVAVVFADDSTNTAVTLKGCLAGITYPYACKKIMSTNTTATDIVALV